MSRERWLSLLTRAAHSIRVPRAEEGRMTDEREAEASGVSGPSRLTPVTRAILRPSLVPLVTT